jgi:hypothetical protein
MEAELRGHISELQKSLAAREERIKQLTDGQAAEASQRERRLRQLQADHAAEVAKLEARIRELEYQLTVLPSPAEPQQNLVGTIGLERRAILKHTCTTISVFS